jgi:hypothetical protein
VAPAVHHTRIAAHCSYLLFYSLYWLSFQLLQVTRLQAEDMFMGLTEDERINVFGLAVAEVLKLLDLVRLLLLLLQ